jgi:hypothetical protein
MVAQILKVVSTGSSKQGSRQDAMTHRRAEYLFVAMLLLYQALIEID